MRRQIIVAVGAVVLLALTNAEAGPLQRATSTHTGQPAVEASQSAAASKAEPARSTDQSAESGKTFMDAAETVMKVTEESAKQAIDTIKEIYATIGIVAAIAVSIAAFFGLREYRQLRKGGEAMVQRAVQSALAQSRLEFEQKLNGELEKLKTTGLERIHRATLITLDTSDLLRNAKDYAGSTDQDEKQKIRGTLMQQFQDLESNAHALKHDRTLSWIWAQRALMSYYEDDLSEAYKYQKMAVDANVLNHVDRHYNLAAIAAKLYCLHRNRDELLSEATKELEIVLRRGGRWDARTALKDSDLAVVFTAQPTLRQQFDERAGRPGDDGSG